MREQLRGLGGLYRKEATALHSRVESRAGGPLEEKRVRHPSPTMPLLGPPQLSELHPCLTPALRSGPLSEGSCELCPPQSKPFDFSGSPLSCLTSFIFNILRVVLKTQAGCNLILKLRMTLSSCSSSVHFLNFGITDFHHHACSSFPSSFTISVSCTSPALDFPPVLSSSSELSSCL